MDYGDLQDRFGTRGRAWIVTRSKRGRVTCHPTTKAGTHNAKQTVAAGGTILRTLYGCSCRHVRRATRPAA